jgi:hypothetical protein
MMAAIDIDSAMLRIMLLLRAEWNSLMMLDG